MRNKIEFLMAREAWECLCAVPSSAKKQHCDSKAASHVYSEDVMTASRTRSIGRREREEARGLKKRKKEKSYNHT